MKSKVLCGIDFLIVMLVSCFTLNEKTGSDSLTTFQMLVISFFIAVVFLALMQMPIIGLIIQILCSAIWTALIFFIFPLNEWTNDSSAWKIGIAIFLFLMFLSLHGNGFADTQKFLAERKKKKQEKAITENSVPLNVYLSRYSTAKNNFQTYNEHLTGAISPTLITAITTAKSAITQLDSFFADPDAILFYAQVPQMEQALKCIEDANTQMLNHYNTTASARTNYSSRTNNENYRFSNSQHSNNTSNSSGRTNAGNHANAENIDESLFSGCTDKDSLTKRYRQLMKTFHPDNQNGDHAMTQKIQQTYETLSKRF